MTEPTPAPDDVPYPTVTLGWEDAETALFCVLHGRARLRALGESVDTEPVDDLAVAAHMLWDALPADVRSRWFGDDTISQRTRRELAHVLATRGDPATLESIEPSPIAVAAVAHRLRRRSRTPPAS